MEEFQLALFILCIFTIFVSIFTMFFTMFVSLTTSPRHQVLKKKIFFLYTIRLFIIIMFLFIQKRVFNVNTLTFSCCRNIALLLSHDTYFIHNFNNVTIIALLTALYLVQAEKLHFVNSKIIALKEF